MLIFCDTQTNKHTAHHDIYIYQPDHHFFIIITSVIPAYHGKDNTAEVNLGWGRGAPRLLPVGEHTAPGKHHRRFFVMTFLYL